MVLAQAQAVPQQPRVPAAAVPLEGDGLKLKVRGLRKTYGAVVALEGASLDLRKGEFVTLLGPSGSGKTTLLMAVAGLNQPDGGEIWIDGSLATYLPSNKRDIGMVFQNYALFPHMTVGENIAFPLKMRKRPGAEIAAAVDRALDLVHLRHAIDRLPTQLSGGQQQRIAVARALVYEPSIILMDEPLGALDKRLRDEMQFEIKHLHDKLKGTFLYVTHDQGEALTMSDRICLMNDAQIEQLGAPSELYFEPVSLFAATFIGDSNVFDGTVSGRSGRDRRIQIAKDTFVTAKSAAEIGSKVKVVVRPEWIAVDGDDASTQRNQIAGTVIEAMLMGAVNRMSVSVAEGRPVAVVGLTAPGMDRPALGRQVTLSWSRESTLVFDAYTGRRA